MKAKAENFSLSSALRLVTSSSSSVPLTSAMSTGEGINSITASSMRCTPLFLNAVPHSIGWISVASVRTRRPWVISSSVKSPSSRYLFISSSLASAAASTIFSRHSLACSRSSAGISSKVNFMPWDASSQMMAFIFRRSTTPLKFSSAPIGITIGTGLAFRRNFICSTTLKKLAPVRSILFTKARRGTLYLLAWRQTVSDWG
ncbi:hypothetical protein FQZ97_879790 [compost metagenome]